MPEQDVVSWTALIQGFVAQRNGRQGVDLFCEMRKKGISPNEFTVATSLKACSMCWDISFGKQVHAEVIKEVFAKLINRDVFTWTVMITGFAQTEKEEKAIKFLNSMQQEGVRPNEFTIAGCLGGCSRITASESGRQLHSMALKSGLLPDMFVSGALVDMYAKCGCIEDAETILKELVRHDKVLWNTIRGFSLHGQGDKALETFQKMKDEGNLPDDVTFIGVLFACSHMDLVEEGKQHFNSLSNVYGVTPRDEHYVCMVDILSHAGRFADVESFVEAMKLTSNALVWENVLGACAKHRNVKFGERAAKKAI
ncbi:hypothetical protein Ahy_B02g060381 [Arachis hypogaea]|uniref:Pentatricopeptide repeat-containing protein n=1 Tax=Arachis hypogaea TaxID=3818 RepID=A0A445AIE7_ARAHY|nr:hypothetical protein Ahy_B02g060381 [Arachis hypogaea]